MVPHFEVGALTVTIGGLTRSVRDTARWLDVANGADPHDPHSLPRIDGWEDGLGSHLDELRGLRVAIIDQFAGAVVSPATAALVRSNAEALVADLGLTVVDVDAPIPNVGVGLVAREPGVDVPGPRRRLARLRRRPHPGDPPLAEVGRPDALRHRGPHPARGAADRAVRGDGEPVRAGRPGHHVVEPRRRIRTPRARCPTSSAASRTRPGNNGKLTIPSNLYGNPAISIPVGNHEGLPVGMQVLARHHLDALPARRRLGVRAGTPLATDRDGILKSGEGPDLSIRAFSSLQW